MCASRRYLVNGYHATVTVPDREAGLLLHRVLGGFPTVADAPATLPHYRIDRDGEWWTLSIGPSEVYASVVLADTLVALEWHLISDMLAFRRDRVHLHGAALRTPEGTASVLILGASGSGKTTLTLALMARDLLPYADDILLIDPDTLAPETFRRAFHVDAATRALIEALPQPPAWDFDALPPGYFMPPAWADAPVPVRAIVFPTLRPGEPSAASVLPLPEAVTMLLSFSGTLDRAPSLALPVAARLVARATCYALMIGDLDATADLVMRLLPPDPGDSGGH